MNTLSKEHFMALWGVLLDNFRQSRSDFTVAFIYQTLMERDPQLTSDQFSYAVQQCLISCKFMPNVNELLRQLYEPDLTGLPPMPDIDPKYADEYQLNHYNKALNIRSDWQARNDHKPAVGHFRSDRIADIPGIPDRARLQGSYVRTEPDFLGLGSNNRQVLLQHDAELNLERQKREAILKLKNAS